MEIVETNLDGCYVLIPKKFGDYRGWFTETYNKKCLDELNIKYDFVQDNMSYSKEKGTLRGLHFQKKPYAQAKLIRCTKGAVFDVVVDARKDSKTYGKWFGTEISEENGKQLLIPRGFLHGFQTLTDDVIFEYKCDNYYSKEHDGGVMYNDPKIGVEWPVDKAILSEKDMNSLTLDEVVKKEGSLF